MIKPDYHAGSIVNLVSSLGQAMGAGTMDASGLASLPTEKVADYANVILFVVDGLGYEYLTSVVPDSLLASHVSQSLTSVFPSTTATAITSLATGQSPLQHGLTGWFMYLDYLDTVTAVLPFKPRIGADFPTDPFYAPDRAYGFKPLIPRLQRKAWVINHESIIQSSYSAAIGGDANRRAYTDLGQCMDLIKEVVFDSLEQKYVYAYWSMFDGLCHTHGVGSEQVSEHFQEIDNQFARLIDVLQDSNTLLLVTADHGMVDTRPEQIIHMEQHPQLKKMLRLPLCGEPRAAYCYLHSGCEGEFVDYVQTELSAMCQVQSSEEMVQANYFGLDGDSHPAFSGRIGDYILLPKDNYIVKDRLNGEKPFSHIGVHGGLSSAEMYVPLCIIETGSS